MRRIAHISDLHFGSVRSDVVEGLLQDLQRSSLDLVCITGDLTQRARTRQFEEARAFLERLPAPWLAVPGNHDVSPVFRPLQRLFDPFGRYRRYVSHELCPSYYDPELTIVGLNTARRLRWAEGDVSDDQLTQLRRAFSRSAPGTFKAVCTHHPFLPPPEAPRTRLVGGASAALETLEQCGVDLLLAGHLHNAYHGDATTRHPRLARSILVVQASTATSTRLRSDPNAYNLLEISPGQLKIQIRAWTNSSFEATALHAYEKAQARWTPSAAFRCESLSSHPVRTSTPSRQ
jgi:3',5'-cyclic AMP phosphodiesterase CpdA